MYLNLKQLLLQLPLDTPLTGADLLEYALSSTDSLRTFFPSSDASELLQTLLRFRAMETITLDISETDELLVQNDVRAYVQVIRKHWYTHPFCLCRADRNAFETWRHAAAQEHQPLLLWSHWHPQAGYRFCAPPLQSMELSIIRELAQKTSASAEELSHNPRIVPQRGPRPYELEKLMAKGRSLPPLRGPSPTDENAVNLSLYNLWRKRYIIKLAPGRFGVVCPTSPRRNPA